MNAQQLSYVNTCTASLTDSAVNAPDSTASLTELVLTDFGSSIDMVMPMLASVSHKCGEKWLTWLGKASLQKELVERFNLNKNHLRTIQIHHEDEILWCLWECLANGTSNTVVACINDLKEADRKMLEKACALGNTNAIILRQRAKS